LRMLAILESGQRTGNFYSVCSGNKWLHDRW
jgi:hypothetical protein